VPAAGATGDLATNRVQPPQGTYLGIAPFDPTGPTVARADEGIDDHEAMALALAEARLAAAEGEVPVGAVVLAGGRLLAARHNERERAADPTAHAELLALRDAAAALGTWRLTGVTVVATLEPCSMCAGALVAARVGRLVYGAADPRAGACGSRYNLCADPRLNHELLVTSGVAGDECAELLRTFFAERRPGLAPAASPPGRSD
jgi:tRNA(adenine34) deaminase